VYKVFCYLNLIAFTSGVDPYLSLA